MNPAPLSQADAPAPYWKCVVAALPELIVGLEFLVLAATRKPLFGADAKALTLLMQVEFLVIHSMAFLGLVALWRPQDEKARKTRAIVFWGLFGLYSLASLNQGWRFFAVFFGLTFVTYLGLFLNWRSESAKLQLGARWAVGFVAFLVANGIFGTPKNVGEWAGLAPVVRAGALYFLALGAVELSGLYLRVIPRNAGAIRTQLRKSKTTQD